MDSEVESTSIFPENEDSTLAAATFEMESNNESDSNEQMNLQSFHKNLQSSYVVSDMNWFIASYIIHISSPSLKY